MTAPTEQPMPTPNGLASVQSMVMADLETRLQVGIERYGTPLQPNNGRDGLRDLYEELLDAVCYTRQLIAERDEAQAVVRYHEALARGLSDYEAREEGWPTIKIENDEEKGVNQPPSVNMQVHYVSAGSADGKYPSVCRAATITELPDPDDERTEQGYVGLMVINPMGIHFQPLSKGGARLDEHGSPYTWHWPERV